MLYLVAFAAALILGAMAQPAIVGIPVGGAIATIAFYSKQRFRGHGGNISWIVFIFALNCLPSAAFYGIGRLFA